jgi:hypothetical protein
MGRGKTQGQGCGGEGKTWSSLLRMHKEGGGGEVEGIAASEGQT